jgi:hypothetical protein
MKVKQSPSSRKSGRPRKMRSPRGRPSYVDIIILNLLKENPLRWSDFDKRGRQFVLNIGKQLFRVDISRPTFYRFIKQFIDQGLVKAEGKLYSISDARSVDDYLALRWNSIPGFRIPSNLKESQKIREEIRKIHSLFRYLKKSGPPKFVNYQLTPIKNKDKKIIGALYPFIGREFFDLEKYKDIEALMNSVNTIVQEKKKMNYHKFSYLFCLKIYA